MLKIRGNKEFVEWWEHWMSRIHPNRALVGEGKPAKAPKGKKSPAHKNKREEANSRASIDPGRPSCAVRAADKDA
ncbi:MAG: hypothetical protein WA628_14765 [Terriglobales bacterium]